MKNLLPLLFVVLSIIGIADAGYLTYEKYSGYIPPCGPGFDCGKVLNSQYAYVLGIPLSAYGLLYYATLFFFAVLFVAEVDLQKIPLFKHSFFKRATALDFLIVITCFGLLFSGYLVILMAFIIKAWCKYCLVSAATSATLFVLVQIYVNAIAHYRSFFLKSVFFWLEHRIYTKIVKRAFFLLDPEVVHDTLTHTGSFLGQFGVSRWLTSVLFSFSHLSTQKTVAEIVFPNPVGLSAGFDYDGDLTHILPSVGFGWHTIGTVTLGSYAGNPKPRLGRFPNSKALLVNKGLKSIGAAAVIKKLQDIPFHIPTGISIASTNKFFANTKEQIMDILQCFQLFEESNLRHAYYELNISCPNTFGGEPFTTPNRLELLLKALDKLKISRPIFVKMPIDQSEKETLELLKVVDAHAITGVIFGNLTKDKNNPAVDPADKVVWQKRKGNLSGKPTFERSNALIRLTKKHYKNRFVIVGTGGIFSPEDMETKLQAGADLVQLITGMIFEGPELIGMLNLSLAEKSTKLNSN